VLAVSPLLCLGGRKYLTITVSLALWKSRHSTIARGRISIQLSLDERSVDPSNREKIGESRGWWDHAPPQQEQSPAPTSLARENSSLLNRFKSLLATIFTEPRTPARKSSLKHEHPIPQPPRTSISRNSTGSAARPSVSVDLIGGRQSPSPSSLNRRLSRLLPTVHLLRETMKDEVSRRSLIYLRISYNKR
jgi:hypothetical protein